MIDHDTFKNRRKFKFAKIPVSDLLHPLNLQQSDYKFAQTLIISGAKTKGVKEFGSIKNKFPGRHTCLFASSVVMVMTVVAMGTGDAKAGLVTADVEVED